MLNQKYSQHIDTDSAAQKSVYHFECFPGTPLNQNITYFKHVKNFVTGTKLLDILDCNGLAGIFVVYQFF